MSSLEQARGELRERFYQSVAETLTLLHTAPGYDRRLAMVEIARILSSIIDLPLVWVGRREPNRSDIDIVAAAGPAVDYVDTLRLSIDEQDPGGQGPTGRTYRLGGARITSIDDPAFAPWRELASRYHFGSVIVAVSSTRDGGQISLSAYARNDGPALNEELLDWAQRLVEELARFWDHQALLERNMRMSRYRDAQRTIQRALLDQPDPDAVYRTLAHALAEIAGAAAVDVYAAEEGKDTLQRVALVGPMAEAMRTLPLPDRYSDDPDAPSRTRVFMHGQPVVLIRPSDYPGASQPWRESPLSQTGAIGCWPVLAASGGHGKPVPVAVIALVTVEADAFDEEMRRLLDEIADAAGLALRQHSQRRSLFLEQQRQTYLALHDALTGLPNRRALDLRLEKVLDKAKREVNLVALGMLDMDDLKPINDRYGHAMGDRILVGIAARLRHALRNEDYVARLGGDEFVLLFDQLESEQDLDTLLDRVGDALQQPMVIDGNTFQLSASLGIALFPVHADANGEQLLRRADQAMYQVKAHKRKRSRWWSLPTSLSPERMSGLSAELDAHGIAPYGAAAAELLKNGFDAIDEKLPRALENYYAELQLHEGVAGLISVLPEDGVSEFKRRVADHVRMLFQPELEWEAHRAYAMRAGLIYGACGTEEVWQLEVIDRLREVLASTLGGGVERDARPLSIVLQRLGLERQWQLESMRTLQRRRVAVLAKLNALAWSAESYLDLIEGVVHTLTAHEEVLASAVGRPDAAGKLIYEAVSGEVFACYLRALESGEVAPILISADRPEGNGPSGRAWRTATVQRCAHYATDPSMTSWRDLAVTMGLISSVAIPLCPSPRTPAAVLTIYGAFPGGFQSEDQQAFVEQIKTVLDLALSRLAPPRPGAELLPFFMRERWRGLIATDAMQMHYQPVVRMADGYITELEALARLRDVDGTLLLPARFLPALGEVELIQLFGQGLTQATACRQRLAGLGFTLDISVNIPAVAVEDSRYVDMAAAVLSASSCPPAAVLLEILESPIGTGDSAPRVLNGMKALKALGVRLVEDDLGAGYSSLVRLRQWPFDRVKIDQALVRQVADDPLRTLRFIRQLIRLGHDLDLEVVVEGLETIGLIEAAMILGADLGQGYALARPMPVDRLQDWLAGSHTAADANLPITALGALASALFWEERLTALPSHPTFWTSHAEASCALVNYLEFGEGVSPRLVDAHTAMHKACVNGPTDPAYRKVRSEFIDLLVEHVKAEEERQDRATPLVSA
jgi:diguanylate cyclase (GGDEF)-like protein